MSYDFYHHNGDTYKVTGKLRNGKRFRAMHYSNPHMALGINLWQGRVHQRKGGMGKWTCVKEVVN